MSYRISVAHNAAEGVWFVHGSDVVGLNAEASTLDELVAVVSDLAPQLLVLNGQAANDANAVELCIQHVVSAGAARAA